MTSSKFVGNSGLTVVTPNGGGRCHVFEVCLAAIDAGLETNVRLDDGSINSPFRGLITSFLRGPVVALDGVKR